MNKIKKIIKNNKLYLIILSIILILFNIISNTYFFISIFNNSKPITYQKEKIYINNETYLIENINQSINIIEINFEYPPDLLTINYTSNSFKNFQHHNKYCQKENIENNKLYILTNSNEEIKNLKLNTKMGVIKDITINPNIPYNLNIFGNMLILITSYIIYNLINKNTKLNLKNNKQKYIIFCTFISLISVCIGFYLTNIKNTYEFGNLYELHYVDAIMNKNLHLDYPVDNLLKESSNPYDTSNRNFKFLWDASYYKGKYYCYFGILPIITLFIPYKIITNSYLTSPLACLIYSILGIIGTYLLYKSIITKYFKKINLQTYIVSFLFIIFGSKLLWCMHRPSFYEVVSLAAYTHITFGLYLTLFKNKRLSNFIGYTLLASSVLCRPTALFTSILLLPKIISNIKQKKWKIIDYLILIIPYLIIGIITMYINYIRFDSIFEFGITYQLTTNNLYNSNFSILNAIFGTYQYLFNKINISLIPFSIESQLINNSIISDINIENIGGGIFTTSIIGIIIIFIPIIFKYIKEKEIKTYIILSLFLTFSLIILSSGIGALIGRYMLDYNYLFYFITVILSLYTINNLKYKHTNKIYMIICLISIIINLILSGTN